MARLSRSLLQANRRVLAGWSFRATPRVASASASTYAGFAARRNVRVSRVTQANIARYAHTDSSSSAPPTASILNVTSYKGSSITEKHWTSQNLPVVDALIAPQVVSHFIEFISYGVLPNGKRTNLALLNPDEPDLFMAPSTQWAPAPFNRDAFPTMYNMTKWILSPQDSNGLSQVGQNIQFVKSRLWEGLAPVSASRWREKDLNNPDHFAIAHEYLTSVITVFEYLNIPQIQTNMRDTFNRISGELRSMQEALNARRKAQSELSPELNLTALWEEFIRAKYEVMTSTAHSWILAHLAELREPTLDSMSALTPEQAQTPEMKIYMQRWTDLIGVASMADFNIWMSMDGYDGYQTPSEIIAGLHNPNLQEQDRNYGFSELLYDRLAKCIEAQNEAAKVQGPSATQSDAARRERMSISTAVQDELREKIRGRLPSPQPPVQPWIQLLLRTQDMIMMQIPPWERNKYGFGIAIYRTALQLSDEQWESLKRDLEADLSAWGDDVQRADELKPLLKLHWFDGKELGFDRTDAVAAARRHYQQIRSSDDWSRKLPHSAFLLIDHMSAGSYTDEKLQSTFTNDKALLPGDFQGHVLAVDADFDGSAPRNESADANPDEGPHYQGQIRILSNLVWSELYPMLTLQSEQLVNLWPPAREHPMNVYTGPTVPSQVEPWKERNAMKGFMMDRFVEFLKKKDPTMAGKIEGFRKGGVL